MSLSNGQQDALSIAPLNLFDGSPIRPLADGGSRGPRPRAHRQFVSHKPMYPGCPALHMQMGPGTDVIQDIGSLVTTEGYGTVFTPSRNEPNLAVWLECVVDHHQLHGVPTEHLLADAARYAGPKRVRGTAPLSDDWIRVQRQLGCPVALTDSGYIAKGDEAALINILAHARSFGRGVVAVLPMHTSWLSTSGRRRRLIELINRCGVPVALVLEHTRDPLGSGRTLRGLVEVVRLCDPPVALLRSDLAAVGAAVFGASFGAIGQDTAHRHLYPIPPRRKDGKRPFFHAPDIGLYVPSTMCFRSLTLVIEVTLEQSVPDDLWRCRCDYCSGAFLMNSVTDEESAARHSLAAIASDVGDLLDGGLAPDVARKAWIGRCDHALQISLRVEQVLSARWGPPDFLGAWKKIIP